MSHRHSIQTKGDPVAAKALADAIVTSRQGIGAPQTGRYSGTLDRRRLSRFATGQTNIFMKPQAPRPNRVRVIILVDASVSMRAGIKRNDAYGYGQTRYAASAQVARDLADATDMLDFVTASMYAYTTSDSRGGEHGSVVSMFPIWETGEPTTEVDSLGRVPMGYTEEGYALAVAHDIMTDSLQNGEQPLVIIISDGAPGEGGHVKSVVADMERDGIPTVSVAIVPSASQPMMYGADNVVDFNGSTIALGYDMARVIGGVL
jgi:nitric oxide reductase activation protein